MENTFISWNLLAEYTTLVAIVFMCVEFIKDLPFIKLMPTKYLSMLISLGLIVLTAMHSGVFTVNDMIIYIISAISISLSGNGLANFHRVKNKAKTTDVKPDVKSNVSQNVAESSTTKESAEVIDKVSYSDLTPVEPNIPDNIDLYENNK